MSLAGGAGVCVRVSGFNCRCAWCDTRYAFHVGRPMSVDEVLGEVARHGCDLVELTGGEPLLQPEATPLLGALLARGYGVLLETGGSLPIEDVPEGVVRIVDVKCPGSGEVLGNRWENLDHLRERDELKFVISGRQDYLWAADQVRERRLASRCAVLFSPVHGALDPAELAGWILEDRLPVRLQIQVHKVLWPDRSRGA